MTVRVEVAIIGAGFAGIGMALALLRDGRESFVLLERGDLRGGGVDLVTDEAIWRCPHVEGLQQRDADAARGVIQGSTIDISRQGCEQSAGA